MQMKAGLSPGDIKLLPGGHGRTKMDDPNGTLLTSGEEQAARKKMCCILGLP